MPLLTKTVAPEGLEIEVQFLVAQASKENDITKITSVGVSTARCGCATEEVVKGYLDIDTKLQEDTWKLFQD